MSADERLTALLASVLETRGIRSANYGYWTDDEFRAGLAGDLVAALTDAGLVWRDDVKSRFEFDEATKSRLWRHLRDRCEAAEATLARVEALCEAGDVRTLDDFREECATLDDLRAALKPTEETT